MTYNTDHHSYDTPLGVTVRLAGYGDAAALVTLAALDSAPFPEGPTLVAEVDGEIQAALPIEGGAPIADPFRPTSGLVQMLRLRAGQLRGDGPKARTAPVYARAFSALRRPHVRPS